ncbi:F-box domain-containing protein [Mycena venus]|uniref:F-box domain-containing protein n=1 Tax=Mycena venus TaxID=2733690 RepID=A0A8H7CW08_9AGAR|nr:F-box domain-containing protein [Mycena venus]
MSNTAALRAQVSDLTLAIARHEQLLDDMRTRLRNLQSQLDSIVYPVLNLPHEITSEFFVHCLPPKRQKDVVNVMEAPLLLTHVCRAWRQIAISTPALWTTFDIQNASSLPRLPEIATAWFERTRKCPLSVRIHGSLQSNVTSNFRAFMEKFRDYSSKIRSLELHTSLEDFEEMGSHLGVLDFPLLQKLSIRVLLDEDQEDIPADYNGIHRMFGGVPLLHNVLMAEVVPLFVALPWQQLTKFTGERYTVEECLEALHLMPNLTECAFSLSDEDADGLEIFSHPNIQHLILFESMSDLGIMANSACILTLVTLPNLQTLEILGADDFDEEELNSFLLRSSPPLQRLAVRPLDSEDITTLQLDPPFMALRLTDLELWHPGRTFLLLFFDAFGWDSGLLPQLRKLSLLGCHSEDGGADVYDILQWAAVPVTTRWDVIAGYAQLQSFRVVHRTYGGAHFGKSYPQAALLPFRKLKASGMDVYVQFGSEGKSEI